MPFGPEAGAVRNGKLPIGEDGSLLGFPWLHTGMSRQAKHTLPMSSFISAMFSP